MTIEFHHLIAWLIGDIFVSRMRIPGGAYFVSAVLSVLCSLVIT